MTSHTMGMYSEMCAWTLTRAHARSGDPIAISAYLGKGTRFDTSIASFSCAYVHQNALDHQGLCDAIAAGRIESTPEPA